MKAPNTVLNEEQAKVIDKKTLSGSAAMKPSVFVALGKEFAWFALSLVICVIFLEVVFRLAHVGEEEFLKIDPAVGFLHLEGKKVTFRSEGYSHGEINNFGFRDRKWSLTKPEKTIRIALLGDSVTEAFQVPIESTFGRQLETYLNKDLKDLHCEVMNFGMSAFSTGQEYLLYESKVKQFKPDITLLMYHIMDSDENGLPADGDNTLPRPYFSLDKNGKLLIDYSSMNKWLEGDRAQFYQAFDWLRRNSRIYGVCSKLEIALKSDKTYIRMLPITNFVLTPIQDIFKKLMPEVKAVKAVVQDELAAIDVCYDLNKNDAVSKDSYISNKEHYEPIQGEEKTARLSTDSQAIQALLNAHRANYKLTEAIIANLNFSCNNSDCKLILVTLPAPNNSFFYFKEIQKLKHFATTNHIDFIDTSTAFPSLAPMQESDLYYFVHFSPKGHRVIAEAMYPQVKKSIDMQLTLSK